MQQQIEDCVMKLKNICQSVKGCCCGLPMRRKKVNKKISYEIKTSAKKSILNHPEVVTSPIINDGLKIGIIG